MLKYFSNKKTLILLILLILTVLGITIFNKLPVDIFPNLNYPLFNIITHYPGGSPEDIETLITRPIENQLNGLNHVRRITSFSKEGLSQVTVEFDWGTDIKFARQIVSQGISLVSNKLPESAVPTIENLGSNLQEIMGFGAIPVNNINLSQLKFLIKTRIANHLRSIPGVLRVEEIGGSKEVFEVTPNVRSLIQYGISITDIKRSIINNNIQFMAGYYNEAYKDYAIRCLGNIKSIDDIKNIPVKNDNIGPILMSDIAIVKNSSLPKRYAVFINGKEGIAFSIFKNKDANTLKVTKSVNKKIAKLMPLYSKKMKIIKYYDQSELINEATNNIKNNILIGGLLVILILFFFIGKFKDALLVSFTIPLIVIISFIFFGMEHLTMNMITLGAIAVAIGMIVDDSIIVLENVERHKEEGENGLNAIKNGVKEIFGPDLTGTLTTISAFIPFIFLSGLVGIFTKPFGLILITMLLVSLFISLTFIPLFISGKSNGKIGKKNNFFPKFYQLNHNLLKKFLKRKGLVIILLILLFIISTGFLVFSKVSFLPQIDEGAILLEYVAPPGTSLKESVKIGNILGNIALKNRSVKTVYQRTGSEGGTFQVEPVNRGELVIKLIDRKKRKKQIFQVIKDLKKESDKIPGIITFYHQVTQEKLDEATSGLPSAFGITVFGKDYNKLIDIANKIEKIAKNTKGVGNIINNTKYKVPELRILPVKEMLYSYGLSINDIFNQLKPYLGGEIVTNIIKNEKSIPVFLKVPMENNLNYIKNIPVKVSNEDFIPLDKFVKIQKYYGVNSIKHINLQRAITLPTEVDGSVQNVIKRLLKKIKNIKIPKGYFIQFGGQFELYLSTIKKFILYSIIAILLIYMIMAFQFGNYIHPLVILFEIPFSFMGAFIAMEITRQQLNLSFFIGLITLMGISVNNGIVLIDYINKRRKEGMSREKAIFIATKLRLRPIFLTAITSIIALFPISLGLGIGSRIHQPLAIAVIGGLVLNIFLTLNVLPVIYVLFEDLFHKK